MSRSTLNYKIWAMCSEHISYHVIHPCSETCGITTITFSSPERAGHSLGAGTVVVEEEVAADPPALTTGTHTHVVLHPSGGLDAEGSQLPLQKGMTVLLVLCYCPPLYLRQAKTVSEAFVIWGCSSPPLTSRMKSPLSHNKPGVHDKEMLFFLQSHSAPEWKEVTRSG